jgi:UDP-2,3-diacylglucosamine hydrolase
MTTASAGRLAHVSAPAHWQAVDFISDLHLHPAEPLTLEALRRYLARPPALRADALFILGDLFEVWVGDDALDVPGSFGARCAELLLEHSRDTAIFFLCGNRDFLVGPRALQACGMQGLADPAVLAFQGQHWLLSHGDALCLDDKEYLAFRDMVRSDDWQTAFLAQPLSQREAVARDLRERSESRKRSLSHDPALWADVDTAEARRWLQRAGARTLIHGHTHRPAAHDLGDGLQRVVLSDWDAAAQPARLDVLRMDRHGLSHLSP